MHPLSESMPNTSQQAQTPACLPNPTVPDAPSSLVFFFSNHHHPLLFFIPFTFFLFFKHSFSPPPAAIHVKCLKFSPRLLPPTPCLCHPCHHSQRAHHQCLHDTTIATT